MFRIIILIVTWYQKLKGKIAPQYKTELATHESPSLFPQHKATRGVALYLDGMGRRAAKGNTNFRYLTKENESRKANFLVH